MTIVLCSKGYPGKYRKNVLIKKLNSIKYVKPKHALNHPNWKMWKKISIDSATMMNKIFEIIEAIKIFNIERNESFSYD